jgi:EF hand domain-containing protein
MKSADLFRSEPVLAVLLLSGVIGLCGAVAAAGDAGEATIPAAVESSRPVPPNKAELADSAFKKLDAGGKGYVTLDDVKDLPNFDKAFEVADANHDGKLTPAEFKKAWAIYVGDIGSRG